MEEIILGKEKYGSESKFDKQKSGATADHDSLKPGFDQPVISVTITEKKTSSESLRDRKVSTQEKFRKSEKPSKLLRQQADSSMTPFAQSLAGKLKGLHALEHHEKVKVDQEIKNRMTKAINKARVFESITNKKFREEPPPISVTDEDGGEKQENNLGQKAGVQSSSSKSPSPQRGRKTGQYLAPPSPQGPKGGKGAKGTKVRTCDDVG